MLKLATEVGLHWKLRSAKNTLLYLCLSHLVPARLLGCLGHSFVQCFARFSGIFTKKISSLAVSIDQKVTKRLLRKCVIQERTIWNDKESSPLPQPPSLCWTPFHRRNDFGLILYFSIVKTTLVIKWTRAALNEADSNGGTKLLILLADAKMQNCRILMNPFPVYSAITF